ncbi:MAG TPA: iron ABC transporter permease [Candidatus Hydrogenedentes bacterium]|nr:iron ABC transporter permease [Candidatus Hydrogenedentota bacterium]HOL77864.1 iron ABC transporter permease [Candidatus Hydrogenedentota bacterium]HPO87029.1 iron ABC transporter permease [Candidatus Hydrogenedentota bacterium]
MTSRITLGRIALLVLISAGIVLVSLWIGAESLRWEQIQAEWRSGKPITQCPALSILINQRIPRTLAALLAGGTLALVGCAFQALLRNPLATPYTLGVAGAGAFGAFAATVLMEGAAARIGIVGISGVQLAAFLCALLDMAAIYAMAARHPRMSPAVLLLTGVTLGMLANAGILFLRYLAKPNMLVVMDRWLMGGVDVIGYRDIKTLAVGTIPCALVLLLQAAKLDQIGFDVELAAGRGINVRRLQAVTFIVGSLATAIVVSTVGPIGFVGLIVPHSVRALTGSRHRLLMPISLFAGGVFLCMCDIIARKTFVGETPIGIITALFGGPFFLYLLTKRRFVDWEG